MVTIANGRYNLPDELLYSPTQHVYLDQVKKQIGLDEIGYAFLQNPTEIQFLVDTELIMGDPCIAISTTRGITTLNAPCSGKIQTLNLHGLEDMKNDSYNTGFLIKLETITELSPNLITGEALEEWGHDESRSLMRNNYSFKIIQIGDTTVGKTAIKVRFTDDYFKKGLKTTLGVDFGSKEIKGEYISSDVLFSGAYRFKARMNIWDIAGQEAYQRTRGMYYRDAKGCLLCYDVNNPRSFENLEYWGKELQENIGKVPVLLVGNKTDLERKVTRQQGLEFANTKGYLFVECSAKTGECVDDIFQKLAVEIFKGEEGLD